MTFRAFIAVDFPPFPALDALAQELRTSGASLKVVATGMLHTTLKFLGETEEGLVPDVVAVLREACRGVEPFCVRIAGTGAFPGLSRMNVVWVGIQDADPLARIASTLDARLEALGFPRERRPWAPHVTLARVKGGRNLDRVRQILQAHAEDAFGDAMVDAVRLKQSVLGPGGPSYTDVERVALPA